MRATLFLTACIAFFALQSCSKASVKPATKDSIVVVKPPVPPVVVPDTIPVAKYDLSLLSMSTAFAATPVTNNMKKDFRELSGVAPSHVYPGLLYVHEDSGNSNEVYVTNAQGDDLGKIVLDGVYNRDWEDIATGPGPEAGKTYIYVAEIGDNDAHYNSIFIYRFAEPDLAGANAQTVKTVVPDKIQLSYPTGAVNAETLLLDPATKDLYITTKEAGRSTLYIARYPQSTTVMNTLSPLAKLPFDLLTSGDISPDGTEILLRNTGQIWYWKRLPNESIATALLRKPQDAPYGRNEHQGEGVGFAADASGYYTNSDVKKYPGDKSAISFYKRN